MMLNARTLKHTASALLVLASLAAVPAFAQAPAGGGGHNNGLETRISDLHQKLQITPEQEKKWQAVAKEMKDGAEASRALVQEKRKDEATLTAAADLTAYADIAEAHAKHARKMAKLFAALYSDMNDDQKKVADEVFREHKRKANEEANQPSAQ
jgi:hypothetical protein